MKTEPGSAETRSYERFTILLDTPSEQPSLGFEDYAQAFADVIARSRAQFSIGIFGSWGSGKTTLMGSIYRKIAATPGIVPVWFNAWRYEREPHLIVPMLDTLREGLVEWGRRGPPDRKDLAEGTASKVARAAKAILAGLSFSAGGVLGASVDPAKVLADWQRSGPESAREPKSFYHASFRAMESALLEFNTRDHRIVIFIDDLDRCLPDSALQVLESMKLFFDLTGFVFVVGLDQAVIERAVLAKYDIRSAPTQEDAARTISGTEYVKKIFQVPFGIPPIRPGDLRAFVMALMSGPDVSKEQREDLEGTVWNHLTFLAEEQSVNPREIKRFINAYTIQLKLLQPKLGQDLDPNRVLAIQALNFRSDWRDLYKLLAGDPAGFSSDLDTAVQDGFWPDRKRTVVPRSFRSYVNGPGAILKEGKLDEYISSAEATHFTDTAVLELSKAVRELWRIWGRVGTAEETTPISQELRSGVSVLLGRADHLEGGVRDSITAQAQELSKQAERLGVPDLSAEDIERWKTRFSSMLESIEDDIDERRRLTSVGGTA